MHLQTINLDEENHSLYGTKRTQLKFTLTNKFNKVQEMVIKQDWTSPGSTRIFFNVFGNDNFLKIIAVSKISATFFSKTNFFGNNIFLNSLLLAS